MEPKQNDNEPAPTVGRIVHYHTTVNADMQHHAALVVHVWDDGTVNLKVFEQRGDDYGCFSVSKGGPDREGTWSYPPRA